MTFSIAEVFLLVWALSATAFCFLFRSRSEILTRMVFDILNNEDLRNRMVADHKKIMKEIDAQ